jgi:hypothetical protein
MLIEKVFAIEAAPEEIWDALWTDLSGGQEGAFEVVEAHRPQNLVIDVVLSEIPSRLSYRIEPKNGHCEVAAILEPRGFRYRISQILTFNHFKRNFEMVLVEGLANLKTSVEGGDEEAGPEEPEPES